MTSVFTFDASPGSVTITGAAPICHMLRAGTFAILGSTALNWGGSITVETPEVTIECPSDWAKVPKVTVKPPKSAFVPPEQFGTTTELIDPYSGTIDTRHWCDPMPGLECPSPNIPTEKKDGKPWP